jgi:hypothetical protein
MVKIENVIRIADSLAATCKANPTASITACVRTLSRAIPDATLGEFKCALEGVVMTNTIVTQFYRGRKGAA